MDDKKIIKDLLKETYVLKIDYYFRELDKEVPEIISGVLLDYGIKVEWENKKLKEDIDLNLSRLSNDMDGFISTKLANERTAAIQLIECKCISEINRETVIVKDESVVNLHLRNSLLFTSKSSKSDIVKNLIKLILGWELSTYYKRTDINYSNGKLLLTNHQYYLLKDRITFELCSPPVVEKGKILWIYANPYIDTLTGPYGLEILDNIATNCNFKSKIVNPFIEFLDPIEGLNNLIKDYNPCLIGFSIRNIDDALIVRSSEGDPNGLDTQELLTAVKKLVNGIKFSGPMMIGGASFGTAPELLLEYFKIPFGIIGAADEAINQLLAEWSPYKEAYSLESFECIWKKLPNSVWIDKNGVFNKSNNKFYTKTLEQNPIIRRTYSYLYMNQRDYKPEAIRGSQGCALGCSYCLESVNRKKMSWRSISDVVDEMEYCFYHYGVQQFHLTDSEANIPFNRLIELAKEIIKRGLQRYCYWTAYLNVRPFETEFIPLLKESGLYRFKFAFDHFHNDILKGYGKNFREKHIEDLIEGFKPHLESGFTQLFAGVLFGGMGETQDTLNYAIKKIKQYAEYGITFYYNTGVRVYPGTPIFEEFEKTKSMKNYYGVGIENKGLSPLVYCSPMPPRKLSAFLEKEFQNIDGVFRMNQEKSFSIGYEGYRTFLVAWHLWLDGREKEALYILEDLDNIDVLPQAIALRRLLRIRNKTQLNLGGLYV